MAYSIAIVIAIAIPALAVSQVSNLPISKFYGQWEMVQVLQSDSDVTSFHNPNSDRWIEFKKDFSFESGGGEYGKNTGN